jgi:superfamily I DNA/RNA helicase
MTEQLTFDTRPPAPDQASRQRITEDLDTTLFVEAGAGSGKTSALVSRVLALVTHGHVELRRIAAITFTEKAGAELRDRIRSALEKADETDPDGEVGARCRLALEQLDGAAIGTLHAFAQRLLTEHPVEAGLPPRVEVLDEVSSSVAFEARWSSFRDQLLADPALERSVLLLLAAGVKPTALQSLAQAFDDNWDLVEERVRPYEPDPPPVHHLVEVALSVIRDVCAEPCRDPDDKLRLRLDEIADRMRELGTIEDELDLLEAIGRQANPKLPSFKVGNGGKQGSWDCDLTEFKARIREAGEGLAAVAAEVANACAHRLGSAIRAFTLESARARQSEGQLEFHDLLVLARALLRDPDHGPAVRATLHDRYDRLLLDEFQDTDPIQIELAVRIAAADPRSTAAGTARWDEVDVAPGHLFVVGDPKQSIYRFRRADIATFLRAAERFGAEGGGVVELTANFRTVEPIIEWVNHTFAELMGEGDDVPVPRHSQPEYLPLVATRTAAGTGPAVSILGRQEHPKGTLADAIRTAEASDVAAAITRIIDEGWGVSDKDDGWHPARLGDITVLVPARTSLPFLEEAFDEAGIAFRAETSSPSATCSWCSGRSTTRPTICTSSPPSARRCWPVGTTTSSASSGNGEGAGATTGTSPTRSRSMIPYGSPWPTCAHCTRSAPGWPPRSCWDGSRRTAGPSSSASPRDGRGSPGGRVDPARERRRRRAHSDHPRRQGAGVPHHHRLGHVDRTVEPVGAGRSGVPRQREPGLRHRGLQVREQGHHQRIRRVGADRRADGPARADPTALRGLHQGPRSPDHVGTPQGAHESAQIDHAHQRRVAPRRHG